MTEVLSTTIGDLFICASNGYITGLYFKKPEDMTQSNKPDADDSQCVIEQCKQQLIEYFKGERKEFDVPIKLNGTKYRSEVWQALTTIPYGQTRSYAEIAQQIGKPKAVRAVGGANHNNPISIIVPCHRVIGANGSLTGYGGGLAAKEWLLNHEKQNM